MTEDEENTIDLWELSRKDTGVVGWEEASEEAKQQMRNAYRIMMGAVEKGILRGVEIGSTRTK